MLRRRRAARAGTADCASAIASNSTDVDLAFCSYRDFYCPDNPPQQCWGRTGAQILDSLGAVYDVYSSADATAACLLIIAGWALLTKLLYFYFSHTAIRGVEPRKRADTRTPYTPPPRRAHAESKWQITRVVCGRSERGCARLRGERRSRGEVSQSDRRHRHC